MAHTFVVKWSSTYTENKTNTSLLSSGGVQRTRQIQVCCQVEEYREQDKYKFVVKWRSTENKTNTSLLSSEGVQRTRQIQVCCQVEEYREDSMFKFIDKWQSTESASPIQNLWHVVDWRVHEFTGKW